MKNSSKFLWALTIAASIVAPIVLIFAFASSDFLPPGEQPPTLSISRPYSEPGSTSRSPEQGAPAAGAEASLAQPEGPVDPNEAASQQVDAREKETEELRALTAQILEGELPPSRFIQLLQQPDAMSRTLAIEALGWVSTLKQGGYPKLLRLWRSFTPAELETVLTAAAEALEYEVANHASNTVSNTPHLVGTMGERALPLLPHLVWASRNHPSPDMRTWCMNSAWFLDPACAPDVLPARLLDPAGSVRLQALQATAITSLGRVIGFGFPTEDEVLAHLSP